MSVSQIEVQGDGFNAIQLSCDSVDEKTELFNKIVFVNRQLNQ